MALSHSQGTPMKLVIFGATGGTGRQLVEQGLAAGHTVAAVVRRPDALALHHPRLTVVRGDVLNLDSLRESLAGQDAVISALGTRGRAPTTLYSAGLANITHAMQEAHVRRLLCVSAGGLNPGPLLQRWLAKPVLWLLLRSAYTDMARMERIVRASELDWTIVRPPMLTNAARTGRYQIATNTALRRGWRLGRADLADYMLRHLDDPSTYRALVEIAL